MGPGMIVPETVVREGRHHGVSAVDGVKKLSDCPTFDQIVRIKCRKFHDESLCM
jgi:hypothetical protein